MSPSARSSSASGSTTPKVTIVGLGPGDPGLVTAATLETIASFEPSQRYLRTARHPSASLVGAEASSFDAVYETASVIGEVYLSIVEQLVSAASKGDVLYAVPGSPAVAERSVELLLADSRVQVHVVPALSFVDLTWVRLGIDPLAEGVRIVDGHRFATGAAGSRGPLLVAQCDSPEVLSEIKLSVDDPPSEPVTVLAKLGLPDESIFQVSWNDLDRQHADHLTSLWIPSLGAPVAGEVQNFVELVTTLRRDCPWDAEQTHGTLRPHLLEETYEVLEALDAVTAAIEAAHASNLDGADEALDEGYELLEEELGDLLFQVVFHAVLGAEAGRFTMADVARGIHDKLRSRHPHVFTDLVVADAEEVVTNWEAIKAEEKQRESVMDGIPAGLPALAYAQKVARRAARSGLDPDPVGTHTGSAGISGEGRAVGDSTSPQDAEEFGSWLFGIVRAMEELEVDTEQALRLAAQQVEAACRRAEAGK